MRPFKAIALDGHDAVGKTTFAKRLAIALGGTYVRPFGPPLGEALLLAQKSHQEEEIVKLGIQGIRGVARCASDNDLLVFDRCWITVLTLLSTSARKEFPREIPTIVCWANLSTTIDRLRARGEDVGLVESHEMYIKIYLELANEYGCPIVDTSLKSLDSAFAEVLGLAKRYISTAVSLSFSATVE
ncbi:MAG TPA: hypothetical protein PLN52_21070 [Opitutaceae bacterium]|nr:hypothetical protein [Opitutaceae bacterium]